MGMFTCVLLKWYKSKFVIRFSHSVISHRLKLQTMKSAINIQANQMTRERWVFTLLWSNINTHWTFRLIVCPSFSKWKSNSSIGVSLNLHWMLQNMLPLDLNWKNEGLGLSDIYELQQIWFIYLWLTCSVLHNISMSPFTSSINQVQASQHNFLLPVVVFLILFWITDIFCPFGFYHWRKIKSLFLITYCTRSSMTRNERLRKNRHNYLTNR